MNRYVKFTGDYSKLKGMGFTFQKLYAGNYMQWERNGIRIWKRGHDITLDSWDLYDMLKFLEGNPIGHPVPENLSDIINKTKNPKIGGYSYYIMYRSTKQNEGYDWAEYTKENGLKYLKMMEDVHAGKEVPYIGTRMVSNELLEDIQELKDLGWLEIVDEEDGS